MIILTVLNNNQPIKEALFVNGEESQIKEGLIITDEVGTKYISLQLGGELLGYKYYNGEYGENEEDKNKCYLESNNEIIGFELDANNIYKIDINANIGRQKIELKNKVIKDSVGNLYVSLEEFAKVCNVVYNI